MGIASTTISAIGDEKVNPVWCPVNCTCDRTTESITCTGYVTVPPNLPAFTRILDLSANRITGISNNSFTNLKNLTDLSLRDNGMTSIQAGVFKGLISLNTLDLSQNQGICGLPDELFAGLVLQRLDLNSCKCKTINPKAFINLTLSSLGLNRNHLTHFPRFSDREETFSFRQSLYNMELVGNAIIEVTKSDFEGFNSLTELNLGHNSLSFIPNQCFQRLNKLRVLILNRNKIRLIGNLSFISTSLRELYLNENPVFYWTDKSGDSFRGLVNLRELYLNYLLISDVEGLFDEMNSLKKLSLVSNRINVIDVRTFPRQFLRNLDVLDLSRNPFECSCALLWFVDWANENK
ncbi:hypothetical protein CAPTEDRAFT_96861, partial [Capitella teleta]